jgi:hypothetical protein
MVKMKECIENVPSIFVNWTVAGARFAGIVFWHSNHKAKRATYFFRSTLGIGAWPFLLPNLPLPHDTTFPSLG